MNRLLNASSNYAKPERLPGLLLGALDDGFLEQRVTSLLETRLPWTKRWRVFAAGASTLVLVAASMGAGMLGVRPATAQGTEVTNKLPVFAAISIRQHVAEDRPPHNDFTSSGYIATNAPLDLLIFSGYGFMSSYGYIDPARIVGVPAWAKTIRYDIQAKVADADVPAFQKLSLAQKRLMLQAMLADRFAMKAHTDVRQVPVYELVVAKSGTKLKEAKPNQLLPNGPQERDGHPMKGPFMAMMGPGQIMAQQNSMENFAKTLGSGPAGRTVINKTGLNGHYSFVLNWTPKIESGPDAPGAPADPHGASLFVALQEQLGLRLQSAQGPEEYFVIDRFERPSEI